MIRYKLTITGRVQGVGFRYAALHETKGLSLTGYVRNLPDGSVEIDVEGEEYEVLPFVEWCRRGPVRARVDQFITEQLPPGNLHPFHIR